MPIIKRIKSFFSFNTEKVTYICYMSSECLELKYLNISNYIINNNVLVDEMFYAIPEELIKKIKKQFKDIKDSAFGEEEYPLYNFIEYL